MSKHFLLPETGAFYKANLHCHSTHSDGKLTPDQIKEVYQKQGYSIVAYTDHRVLINHADLNDKNFLAILSVEVDINYPVARGKWDDGKCYHINLYSKTPENNQFELPAQIYNVDYINQYLKKMKDNGFIACYNHPDWSHQEPDDYLGLEGIFAMEIYNHGCAVDDMTGYGLKDFRTMQRSGRNVFCVAADDNHNYVPVDHPKNDSFGGYTMIKAEKLEYEAIMNALEQGDFYCSCGGPDIHSVVLEDNKLSIDCSPAKAVFVNTLSRLSAVSITEKPQTHHEIQIHDGFQQFQIVCIGENNLPTFTNEYQLK